jgi:hypothetical protein
MAFFHRRFHMYIHSPRWCPFLLRRGLFAVFRFECNQPGSTHAHVGAQQDEKGGLSSRQPPMEGGRLRGRGRIREGGLPLLSLLGPYTNSAKWALL